MDKNQMETKLSKRKGVGIKAVYSGGVETYYFYEDFENSDGITRAIDQMTELLKHGAILRYEIISQDRLIAQKEMAKLKSEINSLYNMFTKAAASRSGSILTRILEKKKQIVDIKQTYGLM